MYINKLNSCLRAHASAGGFASVLLCCIIIIINQSVIISKVFKSILVSP